VYIDIQALQVSLLGGRIFFKGIRYYGNNETILLQSGYVTWSYWLRKVRELDVSRGQDFGNKRLSTESDRNNPNGDQNDDTGIAEGGGFEIPQKLPCRLSIVIKGAEWFVYNRSAAYDSIVAELTHTDNDDVEGIRAQNSEGVDVVEGLKKRFRRKNADKMNRVSKRDSQDFDKISDSPPLTEKYTNPTSLDEPDTQDSSPQSGFNQNRKAKGLPDGEGNILLQFLPIHVECTKAAIVLGNENTKSVLITKFDRATGEIDASSCRPVDRYRQLINFHFEHPIIQIKPNDDYKEDQSDTASRILHGSVESSNTADPLVHNHSFLHRYRRKVIHKLRNLVPYFRTSVESFSSNSNGEPVLLETSRNGPHSNQWQGLSRYLEDNEQDEKARWSAIEYATVSTILDSPEASMSYYWDIAGTVLAYDGPSKTNPRKEKQDINGDFPPEFGLDLIIQGGTINYGPWADRQRADLQRVFFPSLCKDAVPAKVLKPGQARVATKFKLYLQLDKETTLRVPIREESKNWKWKRPTETMAHRSDEQKQRRGTHSRKGKGDKGNPGPQARPFGWLDIKVGANATINYSMDMVAGLVGFSNKLEIDIPNTEITTSVNHGLLWRSVDQRLSCDLSNPLQWNGLHTWQFDITSNGLELFVLREHIFLLIDLVDDWSSGPPPEYLTFSPFRYLLNLEFGNFRLYLNANDSNIINNPSDFDDNTFIIIFGTALTADVCIPMNKFRSHRNDISFDVKAHTGGLNLHVPPWNTQATFLASTELANLKDLEVQGTYQYCATTSPSNTDTLLVNISGRSLELQLYGFLIRYLMRIKDNYFGEDIRFKTLEEYQQILQANLEAHPADQSNTPPHKKSNDLDVILSVSANCISALLPANLYSAKKHIRMETADLALDLRFTNYYMDMELSLSPLALSLGSEEEEDTGTPESTKSGSELFVDGIGIFGHRVFGLPPTEPTYVCNWDFVVGAVTGECSTEFISRLGAGARAFAFSFDDDENALPSISTPALHDVTFLRASIQPIRIWLHVEDSAFLASTGAMEVNFDDWAGLHYSKKLTLGVPELRLACVDAESASRHRSRSHHPVETHALFQTTVNLTMVDRKLGFAENRRLQQQHIKREDMRTHRTDFLLRPGIAGELPGGTPEVDVPAMCFPPLPLPLEPLMSHSEDQSSISAASFRGNLQKPIKRKSSFLSTASSGQKSQRSIIRSHSNASMHCRQIGLAGDSRSRSKQAGTRHSQGTQVRDFSASTGRQSSFYSAVGEVGERRSTAPSSVAFSSSFMAPYFPLEAVEPDAKDLPELIVADDEADCDINPDDRIDDGEQTYYEDETHTSFIIQLKQGIRAYCTPEAVYAVARLLTAIQPVDPTDLLDSLHIDSISDVFALNKQKIITAKSTDLSIRIPAIKFRFANSSPSKCLANSRNELDQYDMSIFGLTVTARSAFVATGERATTARRKTSLLHVKVKSAHVSAKERFGNIADPQTVIDGGIEEVIFWMSSTEKISASLNLKAIEIGTTSSKIEYFATLLHRTTLLASEIGDVFKSLSLQQLNRMQLFTFLVVSAGKKTADPLFLTRPCYVLRAATDHLRVKDSWKIVTRLRHMYNSLEGPAQQDIIARCLSNTEDCPTIASERVLAEFDHWRSWDLSNLSDCVIMQKVYGDLNKDLLGSASTTKPIRVALGLNRISFLIDPGPKQNELTLSTVTIKAAIKNMLSNDTSSESSQSPTMITTIQAYCTDASINLNWELCKLAENVLRLYVQSQPKASEMSHESSPKSNIAKPQHVHIVIATEKGSITLDTINIRGVSVTEQLKVSFVMTEGLTDEDITWSLMIATEAATSKFRSHFQELTIFQMRRPSLYIACENHIADSVSEITWKAAGNCNQLSFVVKQDALALLEVADLLIGDEIAQIHQLVAKLPSKPSQHTKQAPPRPASINKVNVALFLDRYHISLPLLHSLAYNVSGVVARASLAAIQDSDIVFDFDIKENAHDVQTQADGASRSISLLQMPPTNGRITCHLGTEETILSVFASVELLEFEAAAIHSLLIALNRPEISSVMGEVRSNLKRTQRHIEEIFGPRQQSLSKESPDVSKRLIYDAHLTFAGLNAFADTPESPLKHDAARLSFNVGYVQLEAANRLEQDGPGLQFPEVHLNLKQIMCELSRITETGMEPCGNFTFAAKLSAISKKSGRGDDVRYYHVKSEVLEINLSAETASTVLDVMGHLQDRIKDLDLSREVLYLQKLRMPTPRIAINDEASELAQSISGSTSLFDAMYSLELLNIQVSWIVATPSIDYFGKEKENLVLSCKRFDLSTRKENSAKLTIEDLQLQMVPMSQSKAERSRNSALLPEVIFNVAYVSSADARRLAFQAAGKSLDLRLTSQFMIPAADIKNSIESASDKVRAATATWLASPTTEGHGETKRQPFLGKKRMESLLVDADFAGATVYLQGRKVTDTVISPQGSIFGKAPQSGRYGQFSQEDPSSMTVLRAPGLAWKVEFKDNGIDDPSLNAEVKISASSNILYPTVVPLILEISSTVKEIVSERDEEISQQPKPSPPKFISADEENILIADPSAVLGRTRLNLGLRICTQEFSLSCQPIARVAATARFEDIYVTINTVRTLEHGNFFAISASITHLQASVQHVYSRESTGSFDVESVVLSLMNSKHVSGTSGVSTILKISPMKILVNAKQLQDFLLFREIWMPSEIRRSSSAPVANTNTPQSQSFSIQRYQEVAATGAFPWNATVSITELDVQLDLGQAIGKSAFIINNFWVSSKKNSDWEQNLCLGFDKVGVDSTGRMSGFVALQDFKIRTSITWPEREKALNQTPLVQGSLGFSKLRIKASFDYQAFLVADITSFEFMMYNVRNGPNASGDRLVAMLDGDSVQVFCTATTASQGLALYQAFVKLAQEKRTNYEASLKEIERFMKRKSIAHPANLPGTLLTTSSEEKETKSPISLHTDVVVTLKAVDIGAFPSTFFDHQVFKLEALDAQARFAVSMNGGKIHSGLGLTLGQLRIGLAGVKRPAAPKASGDISVEEVVEIATGSHGGTILKVPKVDATMETWQSPDSNRIDYIFKSSFEGKVEVGWNYSRISYIRGMYANHTRALAQRLGKPLPPSAVKITGVPDEEGKRPKEGEQQKIVAEVTVPQSKYEYVALKPPIIETPQLRDMGEATPPLEWIGLHRDRLPNLTHQIVIVTLLEIASEVEDAYGRILGSS
jgi:hypothetical protein